MPVPSSSYICHTTDKCYFITAFHWHPQPSKPSQPSALMLYISTGLPTTSYANFCCPLLQLSPSEFHGGLKYPFHASLPPFPPNTLENYCGLKLTKTKVLSSKWSCGSQCHLCSTLLITTHTKPFAVLHRQSSMCICSVFLLMFGCVEKTVTKISRYRSGKWH